MKIQCSCGAKYALDVSLEMATNPVRFVCPACGLDASDFVNDLVRKELGLPATATAKPAARMRVRPPEPTPAEAAPADSDEPQLCPKHPGQFSIDKCRACSKPICPKCMELFGYVCSPLCKARAESRGIQIPVYAGQKSVKEARTWRRIGLVASALGGLAALMLGFWIWYAWIGSMPRVVWSVPFAERSYSGQSAFCGKDQIVFLHGDTLARHDMKLKKELWSRHLVDKKQIDDAVTQEMKRMSALIDKITGVDPDRAPKMPNPDKLRQDMQLEAEAALELIVRGQNIWVLSPGKLTRYDRDTGQPVKEILVPAGYGGLIPRGDELLDMDLGTGKPLVTRINLNTCESRTEQVGPQAALPADAGDTSRADAPPAVSAAVLSKAGSARAGLPVGTPGKDMGKLMDPRKVEEQAQHLSYPAKIALPAILAHNMNQERTLAAYDDHLPGEPAPSAAAPLQRQDDTSLIPTKDGFILFSVKLLESRVTERAAMKPAPAKSVLDGNLTVEKTAELANEMLNEAQRARGGDVVREDDSLYQVTIRRVDAPGGWSGQVTGPPTLYPLTTVNVLAANKSLCVLDKTNRPLWQSPLTYNVSGGLASLDPDHAPYGLGPCVEREGSLYVFDQGVLTAFDIKNGNVRWRLPSIGISGLFFDDQGMIYVNTTTAGPDTIKYSNQIDITRQAASVVMKVDPRTGKGLWTSRVGGLVNYASGPFIYTVQAYQAEDNENGNSMDAVMGQGSFMCITRVNPKNGRVMWKYPEPRAPLDVQFDRNTIRLVFRKEVEVLRFHTL